jgi:hypothetical protein
MDATIAAPRQSGWSRPFLAVIGGAALLIVAGIVVAVVVAHNRGTTQYSAGSPQGTVQRYLTLLQAGNTDRAYRMTQLPEFGVGLMTRADFNQQFSSWGQTAHQVTLDSTRVSGSEASVTVQISSFSGGPLGASSNSNRVTFTLNRVHGRWLITGPTYLP